MKTVTSLAVFTTLLLAANAHAAPQTSQTSQKPMDHSKMKMEHAGMQMPATPEARAKMANTMFDKIDTNKDGSLSRAEFVAHHRNMSMDHGGMNMQGGKHDGAAKHQSDHARHAAAATSGTFAKLDSNKDGKLSKAEMGKHPMAAHFPMMDTDKSGYLSAKEAAAHGL